MGEIEKCRCDSDPEDGTCPYKSEIHNNHEGCECCDYCRQQCAWDI